MQAKATGYLYPLLVVQDGSGEVNKKGTRVIKRDFKGLVQLVDGAGVQVVFCGYNIAASKNFSCFFPVT